MMCKVLIFGCIAAVILMTAAYGAPLQPTELSPAEKEQLLKASVIDLQLLRNIKNNFLDFYTPNDIWECNQTTLQCYLTELDVLIEDTKGEERRHLINIKKNLTGLTVSNSSELTCKKCEANEKKKFPEFHQAMSSFLQSMLREIV